MPGYIIEIATEDLRIGDELAATDDWRVHAAKLHDASGRIVDCVAKVMACVCRRPSPFAADSSSPSHRRAPHRELYAHFYACWR